jgi:branched-subunit amino acid transport protein
MRTLLVFLIGGAVSWLFRVAFIAVAPNGQVPPVVVRALRNAAPATFAAIIAVTVSNTARGSGQLAGWPVVAAAAITLVVALRTRHVLLTLVVGALAATVLGA